MHASPRQEVKRQYSLLHRIEKLMEERNPPVTRTTLDILHHFITCEHLNESGVKHANMVVGILERGA